MRIVSGGQSGVDRAALDVALEMGLECGGWCPAGRWAEDGTIDGRYPLKETPSTDPAERTAWNVRDSDATLVLATGAPAGGTEATLDHARRMDRPFLLCDPHQPPDAAVLWIRSLRPGVLNVAGPRESEATGINAAAAVFLRGMLERLSPPEPSS